MKKKRIKASWKEYFNFTAREKRGTAFLAIILFTQVIVLFYLKNKNASLLAEAVAIQDTTSVTEHFKTREKIESKSDTIFYFDPNLLSDTSWEMLGLRKQQVAMINKYIQKGGRFYRTEDFAKLYCITPEEFQRLSPYIRIPQTATNPQTFQPSNSPTFQPSNSPTFKPPKSNSTTFERKEINVDISTADSVELESLPGIGPVLASRIVRYRERLGGFVDMNQLTEVYGITDSLLRQLSSYIYMSDTIPFRSIKLNTDSFKLLLAHPYVNYKVAGLICTYRKQHGGFRSAEELREIPLINGENFRKLAAYAKPE